MALQELTRPYEILEIADKESVTLSPVRQQLGTMVITPRNVYPPTPKTITVLRLWADRDKTLPGLEYVDITSQTLIAQLAPLLDAVIKDKKAVKIAAFGQAPKKRFTVSIE